MKVGIFFHLTQVGGWFIVGDMKLRSQEDTTETWRTYVIQKISGSKLFMGWISFTDPRKTDRLIDTGWYCWWFRNVAPVEGKVVYPIIYMGFYHQPRWWSPDFWTITSSSSSFFSQQTHLAPLALVSLTSPPFRFLRFHSPWWWWRCWWCSFSPWYFRDTAETTWFGLQ